ncbi:MAG: DNRLRE domain-containing protein [Omnitrophica WOR_2 bacterium]
MKRTMFLFLVCGLVIFMLGLGWLMLPKAALAREGVLPQAVTITSADLSINIMTGTVTGTAAIHRITSTWTENSVTWNNFNGKFNPTVIATFTPKSTGWVTVSITSLVQGWVNGTYPNYGLAITKGNGPNFVFYHPSIDTDVLLRPKLKVCYDTPASGNVCRTIQRLGSAQDGVMDSFVCKGLPDFNPTQFPFRSFGQVEVIARQSFLRFDFNLLPTSIIRLPAIFNNFKTP